MTRPEDLTGDPPPVRITDQMDTVREGEVRMINQYRIGDQVGKGQHGEVWLCEDTRNDNGHVVRHVYPNPRLLAFRLLPLQSRR